MDSLHSLPLSSVVKWISDKPLFNAVSNFRVEIVRELIKRGANVNFIRNGHTPLFTALLNQTYYDERMEEMKRGKDMEETIEALVQGGASMSAIEGQSSPFIDAINRGDARVVTKFVQLGAIKMVLFIYLFFCNYYQSKYLYLIGAKTKISRFISSCYSVQRHWVNSQTSRRRKWCKPKGVCLSSLLGCVVEVSWRYRVS